MSAPVTIHTSEVQRVFSCDWVDTLNTEHLGEQVPPGYGNVTWTMDPAGVPLVQISTAASNCTVKMLGPNGSFNLTCKASKAGSPDMVDVTAVTIAGPTPSRLNAILLPVGS